MNQLPDTFTIAEASKTLGIPPITLRVAILQGRLKGRKSGKTWLIEKADLEAAIRAGRLRIKGFDC